jgi:hypothetical protein
LDAYYLLSGQGVPNGDVSGLSCGQNALAIGTKDCRFDDTGLLQNKKLFP